MLKLILITVCAAAPLLSAVAVGQKVPDGMLTYEIVLTGHGEQHGKAAKAASTAKSRMQQDGTNSVTGGGDASTEKSETQIRWTIEVTEKVSREAGTGRITASGRLEKQKSGDVGTVAAAATTLDYLKNSSRAIEIPTA